MKEFTLPSGRTLKVSLADYMVGKRLCQALLKEAQVLGLDAKAEIDYNFFKNIVCSLLVSESIEKLIWEMMPKATINDNKIDHSSFDAEEHRGDYFIVMKEVGLVNLVPFSKSLITELQNLIGQGIALLEKFDTK